MEQVEVVILQTFGRYPEGGGAHEQFQAGWTRKVSKAEADQWIAKGLARLATEAPAPAAPSV